jgi:hypothetical protein
MINCSQMPIGFAQTSFCDTIFLGLNTATTIYPGQNNGGPMVGGSGSQTCYTLSNNGQMSTTCAQIQDPGQAQGQSVFFTTSTQSFCNTFNNGGQISTSCTANLVTLATRTQLFDNAAARETGVAGRMGHIAVGLAAVGAGFIL